MNERYLINSPNVISEEADGDTVVINRENNNFYSLNSSAAYIWVLLDSYMGLEQIADCYGDYYQLDSEIALAETEDFLNQLVEEDLITKSGEECGRIIFFSLMAGKQPIEFYESPMFTKLTENSWSGQSIFSDFK